MTEGLVKDQRIARGWIKTTEALPQAANPDHELYVRCLAYYKPWGVPPSVVILVWDCGEEYWVDDEHNEFVCRREEVSHWMPVPADPRADDLA